MQSMRQCAQKGVGLCEYVLTRWTREQDAVLDPFAGTASMGVACLNRNRMYFGGELDPKCHKLATARLVTSAATLMRRGQKLFKVDYSKGSIAEDVMYHRGLPFRKDNCPDEKSLAHHCKHNRVVVKKTTECTGVGDLPLGKGVFATADIPEGNP